MGYMNSSFDFDDFEPIFLKLRLFSQRKLWVECLDKILLVDFTHCGCLKKDIFENLFIVVIIISSFPILEAQCPQSKEGTFHACKTTFYIGPPSS